MLPLASVGCPVGVGVGALPMAVSVLEGAGVRGAISIGVGALASALAVLELAGVGAIL